VSVRGLTRISFVALSFGLCFSAGDDSLLLGSPKGGLTIVIYEDLQCPDCSEFQVMFDRSILPRYERTVEFVFRDFPLEYHKWALKAAIASRFFSGKNAELGFQFRRWILASQKLTTTETFDGRLRSFALQNGINPLEAVQALDDPRYRELVLTDIRNGLSSGVKHTPTVIVDGQWLTESIRSEDLAKAIDSALQRAHNHKVR
jgi:protein-disulfide isomerase